jgi:hypothetical protein
VSVVPVSMRQLALEGVSYRAIGDVQARTRLALASCEGAATYWYSIFWGWLCRVRHGSVGNIALCNPFNLAHDLSAPQATSFCLRRGEVALWPNWLRNLDNNGIAKGDGPARRRPLTTSPPLGMPMRIMLGPGEIIDCHAGRIMRQAQHFGMGQRVLGVLVTGSPMVLHGLAREFVILRSPS